MRRRLFHSVFFRLVAAIVIAGIAMTLTVMGSFYTIRYYMIGAVERNFRQYVKYLIKDIGTPPDQVKAKLICEQTGMKIHFKSPGSEWTAPENGPVPDFGNHRRIHHQNNLVKVGSSRQGFFITVNHESGQFTFWQLKSDAFERQAVKILLKICVILLVILTGAYLYIRRVMQPVRWLTDAMNHYSSGNLGFRMPLKRGDEFQDLAESVNRMAERIQMLLTSKEKLLLDVSHELRSPIARLKVAIEMLDDETAKEELAGDLVEMEAMVTEILETARMRHSTAALNLQKVNIKKILHSLASEFDGKVPGIQYLSMDDAVLTIDPQKIRTALKNIIDNAVKYSQASSKPVQIAAVCDGSKYRVTVEDFGIGIAEEELGRIFEPFYRVDHSRSRQTGGFGLGLSLCKAIVTAHGGSICIDSKPDQGTLVTVELPM